MMLQFHGAQQVFQVRILLEHPAGQVVPAPQGPPGPEGGHRRGPGRKGDGPAGDAGPEHGHRGHEAQGSQAHEQAVEPAQEEAAKPEPQEERLHPVNYPALGKSRE